ncbi:hypothetical protein BDAP_001816 [Binucleata daphniae]
MMINKLTEKAIQIIGNMNLKTYQAKENKNIMLKEIRQRGFQHKKKTKFGIKTLENIRFGELVCEINGEINVKEECEMLGEDEEKNKGDTYNKYIDLETAINTKTLDSFAKNRNEIYKDYNMETYQDVDVGENKTNLNNSKISDTILKHKLIEFILHSEQNKKTNYIKNHETKKYNEIHKKHYFKYFITDDLVLISENNYFRKGCRPNVTIKIKKHNDSYHIGLYSTRYIYAREEIALPFDTDTKYQEKCVCIDLEHCLYDNNIKNE